MKNVGIVGAGKRYVDYYKDIIESLEDRKSVVQGKSVDLGGRRIIKKKKMKKKDTNTGNRDVRVES